MSDRSPFADLPDDALDLAESTPESALELASDLADLELPPIPDIPLDLG